MKAKETISAYGGVLTFWREFCVAVDQVQHLEAVEYAPAFKDPLHGAEGVPCTCTPAKWRLEVKVAHRASPFYPFEGSEGQVRKKLALAANALRKERERIRELELAPWRAK